MGADLEELSENEWLTILAPELKREFDSLYEQYDMICTHIRAGMTLEDAHERLKTLYDKLDAFQATYRNDNITADTTNQLFLSAKKLGLENIIAENNDVRGRELRYIGKDANGNPCVYTRKMTESMLTIIGKTRQTLKHVPQASRELEPAACFTDVQEYSPSDESTQPIEILDAVPEELPTKPMERNALQRIPVYKESYVSRGLGTVGRFVGMCTLTAMLLLTPAFKSLGKDARPIDYAIAITPLAVYAMTLGMKPRKKLVDEYGCSSA